MATSRLSRLRDLIRDQGLDCLLVTEDNNRRYMSGFTGSTGILVITPEKALIATDFRYFEQVARQCPDFELAKVTRTAREKLAEVLMSLGVRKAGFEAHHVTVETLQQWQQVLPDVEWVSTIGLIERLRMRKDAEELAAMRRAVAIADEAMAHIMEWIEPGVTERDISWELEVAMRTRGAEALSFTTIVGSGPNGAMSHAVVSERVVQAGDPLVIDMGCVYAGYCSDLTRSFCVREATEDYLSVWNTVLQAQLAAERAIKTGLGGFDADKIARDIIYGAGYEGKFGHGLGHGVGLAIHEEPRASITSTDTLESGNILTVEPGIYDPTWGGVRIEDMVVVTEDGADVLTQVAKVPVI